MCLFRIVGGKLVPTNPEFEDFYDVRNALGFVDAGEPMSGDIAVVVADARKPIRRVPKDALTVTTVSEPNQDVYLFWAINEDDDGNEVIVAFDNFDVANNYDDLWRIIGFDEWVQLPLNKELIRAFQNVEQARSYIHGNNTVIVPFSVEHGWHGVGIHGPEIPEEFDQHPRVIKAAEIPTGWKVYEIIDTTFPPALEEVITETEIQKIPARIPKEAEITHIIGTMNGGAAIVTRFKEGESGGFVIASKIFTHEEAKNLLRL